MLGSTSEDRHQVDPAEALMREVGAQLREVRLERGEDVDDVARHLRIKSSYLSGIERGELSALPGRTYALGFLRSYADYLGFDGDDLVGRIKASVGQLTDRTRLRIRTPMPENRLPRTPMVVLSLAAVAGIYLGWSYVNRTSRTVMDTVAEVPDNLRQPGGGDSPASPGSGVAATEAEGTTAAAVPDDGSGESEGGPPAEIAAAGASPPSDEARSSSSAAIDPEGRGAATRAPSLGSGPVATDEVAGRPGDAQPQMSAATAPQGPPSPPHQLARGERDAFSVQPAAGGERGGATSLATPTGRTATQDATAASPETAGDADPARRAVALLLDAAARGADGAAEVYETANTDARVILRAREPTWIQVSSPAGDYRFTRTLAPGEAVLVPNRADLVLWTGNAGGLEIMVDGVPVAALAGAGAVRRNISLDPGRLSRISDRSR